VARQRPDSSTWGAWDPADEATPPHRCAVLPDFGQELGLWGIDLHHSGVPDPALVSHVVATTSLTPGEAARVIDDVIAFHAQSVEDYVRSRHAHLKTYGAKNPEIFARIAEELEQRVVAAPELTERQLRRMIYG